MEKLQSSFRLFFIFTIMCCCQRAENNHLFDDKLHLENMTLILEDHELSEVPDEIGKLSNLKSLSVKQSSQAWTIFPPFDAWDKKIEVAPSKELTDGITNLRNLESLSLSTLQLTALPKDFDNLKNLDSLNISMNYLIINDELKKLKALKNLTYINILGNRIDTLEIKKWQNERPSLKIVYSIRN